MEIVEELKESIFVIDEPDDWNGRWHPGLLVARKARVKLDNLEMESDDQIIGVVLSVDANNCVVMWSKRNPYRALKLKITQNKTFDVTMPTTISWNFF